MDIRPPDTQPMLRLAKNFASCASVMLRMHMLQLSSRRYPSVTAITPTPSGPPIILKLMLQSLNGWVARNTAFAKELLPLETLVGPDYGIIVVPAATAMEEPRAKLEEAGVLLPKHCSHRRGEFCAFAVGNSHGGGRKVCHSTPPSFI
jgi:hypothetical protein